MQTNQRTIRKRLLAYLLLACLVVCSPEVFALDVGDQAPDFTLPSTLGESVSMQQFKGRKYVLIEFYSLDFNPTWTANLQARMADYDTFEKLNIQLLAISSSNPFSQKMFAASLKLPYPLLSDHPHLEVIQRYDVLEHMGEARQPIARASYFLIDKQGVIRGKWLKQPGEVFPNDILLKTAHEIIKWSAIKETPWRLKRGLHLKSAYGLEEGRHAAARPPQGYHGPGDG